MTWHPLPLGSSAARILPSPSGDGTGAADKAALQAFFNALPAGGAWVGMPNTLPGLPGTSYTLNGPVAITKPVKLVGAGGGIVGDSAASPAAPSTIYVNTPDTDGLTVSAAGCTFEDFAVVNTSGTTPTAGAGIKDAAMSNSTLRGVTVLGFYNCLDLGGTYYTVDSCHIYDPVNYGAYLHAASAPYNDHGDMGIHNTVFSSWTKNRNWPATIRYESGGGLRFIGNKINGGGQPGQSALGHPLIGIDLVATAASSSLTIIGNSISACEQRMVSLTGAAGWADITISGNEIATGLGAGNACIGVYVNYTGSSIHEVEITGNDFFNLAGGGIVTGAVLGLHIGPNHFGTGVVGPLISIASGVLGNVALGVRVDKQSIGTLDSIDIVKDNRNASITNAGFSSSANVLAGGVDYDYQRNVILTANGVWQTEFIIKVPRATGGVIEVELSGQNGITGNSSGASRKGVYIKQVRAFDVSTSDVVTLTTVGTDVANGAGAAFLAVQYVLAANQITVQVQTTDATQLWFGGACRCKASGKLDTFHIGA